MLVLLLVICRSKKNKLETIHTNAQDLSPLALIQSAEVFFNGFSHTSHKIICFCNKANPQTLTFFSQLKSHHACMSLSI